MVDILQKIKDAQTMREMDNLRDEIFATKTNESLMAWQKKYRSLKYSRKEADIGYKYQMR